MANTDQAAKAGAGLTQAYAARVIASGAPLAAAVYVASGRLWVGVSVALVVAITGGLVRKLRFNSGAAHPVLPAE